MIKRIWGKTGIVLIAMLVLLSGCSKDTAEATADQEETAAAEEGAASKTETGKEDDRDSGMKSESGSASAPAQEEKGPVKFYVYFSNEDASGFAKEEVEAEEITPEAVRKALTDKGALPEDVKINSLEESKKDGEKVLDVDVSQEFAAFTGNMGSTGEYMALGSLCNTFLDAYACEKIHITVEGGVLSTGHNEYPGYLGFHE